MPFVTVAYVCAAVSARVLAIGDAWDGFSAIDAVALQCVRWWTYRLGSAGEVLGNPWLYFALLLLLASQAVPESGVGKPPARHVSCLRAAVVCALVCVAAEACHGVPTRVIPISLGSLALLAATLRGLLPSWQVALGAWVLTSRMGWTTGLFARWHEGPLPISIPAAESLAELAPASVALQLSAALALYAGSTAPHSGLRRLAALWALFAALDTALEVTVAYGLTQRDPWTTWMLAWSFVAQAVACGVVAALAASAYTSLRAALHREELDPRFGGRAAVAAVFGLAMLAPALTRHPVPWDVGDAEFGALGETGDVTSLRALPAQARRTSIDDVLIGDAWGSVRDAQTGRYARELTGREYGLIMDQDASVSDFARAAAHALERGATQVQWALPLAVDDDAVAALPARYALRGIARRPLVYVEVSAYLATPHAWHSNDPPPDASLHLVAEAFGDETPLRTLLNADPPTRYGILFNPDDLFNVYRPSDSPPRVSRNPLRRLFRDSAHTIAARLLPLLGALLLGYFAFLLSIERDLRQLAREHSSGEWLRSSEPLAANPSVPRFPPWIPPDEAHLVRLEGSPYRAAAMTRATSSAVARAHAKLSLQGLHHIGAAYAGVVCSFLVAVTVAALG